MGLDKLLSKKGTFAAEAESQIMSELMEQLLPKLGSFIEPALQQLKNILGEDEKIMILRRDPNKNEIFLIVLETKNIESFEFNQENLKVFPVTEFLPAIIKGDFSSLL